MLAFPLGSAAALPEPPDLTGTWTPTTGGTWQLTASGPGARPPARLTQLTVTFTSSNGTGGTVVMTGHATPPAQPPPPPPVPPPPPPPPGAGVPLGPAVTLAALAGADIKVTSPALPPAGTVADLDAEVSDADLTRWAAVLNLALAAWNKERAKDAFIAACAWWPTRRTPTGRAPTPRST